MIGSPYTSFLGLMKTLPSSKDTDDFGKSLDSVLLKAVLIRSSNSSGVSWLSDVVDNWKDATSLSLFSLI